MTHSRCRGVAVLIAVWLCCTAGYASPKGALGRLQVAIQSVEADAVKSIAASATGIKTPEQRLAIGEMLKRNEDFPQAILLFNQVLELFRQGKVDENTHANALFLLGETYFESGQLPSARRHFRTIVENADQEPYLAYAGRALSRLVDVALRRGQLDELDFVFERLERTQRRDPTGALDYARSKALFAAQRYPEAVAALAQLPKGADFEFQAQYLLGVIFTNQAQSDQPPTVTDQQLAAVPLVSQRFARAILQFQELTQLTPNTEQQQHIVDLAWLALGRIFYETESPLDAVDAYQRVGKTSPEFATMLFELAWVYVSLEDYAQAQHTLEVLEIVAPESLGVAEGALLRADLMLRAKDFDNSLRAYQAVRARFSSAYEELDRYLKQHADPADYYDRLVQQRLGVRTPGDLPAVVLDWVREIEDERSFALIDDVTRSRDLATKSQRMARTMAGVLNAPSRVRAFPDLLVKVRQDLGLMNRLVAAKRDLAQALTELSRSPSAELRQVREQRAALEPQLEQLPVRSEDFIRRDLNENRRWDHVSQQLQQLGLQSDHMRAMVNGVRRLLQESQQFGVSLSAAQRASLTEELKASEADLDVYQRRIAELRDELRRGRLQVGFGGASYEQDHQARAKFDRLFAREIELTIAGQAGNNAAQLARDAKPWLDRLARVQTRLAQRSAGFQASVEERATVMLGIVEQESRSVDDASTQLEGLDQQARHLFGELAKRSFEAVRERLASILIRADIGIAQQAWEVRQAHLDLVQHMQRVRATREQRLNEEYREVLQDGSGEEP